MSQKKTFWNDFKIVFGRGLAVLLPSIVTLWLLWQAFGFVFQHVAEPINRGIRTGAISAIPRLYSEEDYPAWYVVTPDEYETVRKDIRSNDEATILREARRRMLRAYWKTNWWLNGLGFVVAILLIYLAGKLLGNYLGRAVYVRVEALIARIPGFKQVYPHVKQVVDIIFGENSTMKAFNEVVLVEYPRKGIWTIGLLTGTTFEALREGAQNHDIVSVFIPTSPTPMTGFVINVPRAEAIKLDMTIDQALRFVITGGVLTPDNMNAENKPVGVKVTSAAITAEVPGKQEGEDPDPAPEPRES